MRAGAALMAEFRTGFRQYASAGIERKELITGRHLSGAQEEPPPGGRSSLLGLEWSAENGHYRPQGDPYLARLIRE